MTTNSDIPITRNPEPITTDAHSRIAGAAATFSVSVRLVGLYGHLHPSVAEAVNSACQALARLLILQPTVAVAVCDSFLALDGFPIQDNAGVLTGFAKLLHEKGVTGLMLSAGVTEHDVLEFAEALNLSAADLTLRGGIATELKRRNVTHIQTMSGAGPVESRLGKEPADIYQEALLLVEEALKAVRSGLQIPVSEIRNVVADSMHNLIADETALLALAGIRSYDRYLSEHSLNVCILSMALGRDLGLDPASTLELGISAMLHDVGKVFIPGEVVKKPGRLTEDEWRLVRRHPAEGARALAGLLGLPALAATIALEHHMWCDNTGYPKVPAANQPHLLSRLVAIVDSYDALTTERPYRQRWTPQQAIGWMLYEASGHYDQQLMSRFASKAQLHAVGALVRLANGELAVVTGGSYVHPSEPTVRIVVGESVSGGKPPIIDLSTNTDPGLEIAAVAQPVEAVLQYAERLLAA